MKRRTFLRNTSIAGAGALTLGSLESLALAPDFKVVRVAPAQRKFTSKAIEKAIAEFGKNVKNKELAWLFNNCFPNTLDTTVTYTSKDGRPDTYVITGDIDAMWLRDSTAQVWPYLTFINKDAHLKDLIAGVISRQAKCINKDPYANAFYDDDNKVGEWSHDLTQMKPGLHERKWEIDSLCYPVRLSYHYWKSTGDTRPFDATWQQAVKNILKTFKEQQRKNGDGPYSFQRKTAWATDGVPMNGYGYPVKPVGLICSAFRPSDDATIYSFLIPSNFFAVVSLKQAAEMMTTIAKDSATATELSALATEVEQALKEHAIASHPKYGKIYAYEVNGFGSYNIMDDANIPSLLALPYLGAVDLNDEIYQNTRKLLLSEDNPFFFKGTAGEGIGGPHIGKDMIWPLSIIARGLTSTDDNEIRYCIQTLQKTHGDTGFMHESFHKDNPAKFTRSWFAWTNTIFGEFLWKTYQTKPQLLS
ncbi:glycoside hydrolase family 125 protein [Mucilaginibacter sp. Bleaf8]|uniref:glycoside hydrolase family 125 protein n=1 Tax=Mucilaginibacter sp. Bleaf8 TaxID=2834430 RepID=UPI001BCC0727|nr:glycoside hydrolase family 125 protein [Mucilaginibacter sp. Bleaf8]MBS7564092.1 glycoside hydrolase family 125 protein [Mucilaginibacter sp. Bleaf8]